MTRMTNLGVATVVVVVAAIAAGCDDRADPTVTGSSTTTGGGSTSGGGAGAGGTGGGTGASGGGCDSGYDCVEVPTDGAYVIESQTSSCMEGTARYLLDCNTCSACGAPVCEVTGEYFGTSDCSDMSATFDANGVDCSNTPNKTAPVYVNATVSTNCGESSEPTTTITACQIDTLAACGSSGLCVPPMDPGCLLVPEGTGCPAAYSDIRHLHEGDSCGCTCEKSTDCPATVTLYTEDDCTLGETTVAADGICNPVGLTTGQVRAAKAPDPGGLTCTAKAVPPAGMPMQMCCRAQ